MAEGKAVKEEKKKIPRISKAIEKELANIIKEKYRNIEIIYGKLFIEILLL